MAEEAEGTRRETVSTGLHHDHQVADVGAWVMRGSRPAEDQLSSSHVTLGAFLAPSIVVRDIKIDSSGPYLARWASALVEARIMPGQDAATIARAIAEFIKRRIPNAEVEPILIRPAAKGGAFESSDLAEVAPVIPVSPGNSPAGMLETAGIPTLGYSTVWRNPGALDEVTSLSAIADGSTLIQSLVHLAARSRTGE